MVREVKAIIVGAMRFVRADGLANNATQVHVEVEFESNYTEVAGGGHNMWNVAYQDLKVLRWLLTQKKS